jgi:hypothetical protein
MSIVVAHEAVKLIRDLDEALPHIEGLSKRVTEFLRVHDYVENVGIFEVDSVVYFDPSCNGSMAQHAKVVANYGTADGRVLYDIALSFTQGATFATSIPLRDVVPAFIRGIDEATQKGVVPKEIHEGFSATPSQIVDGSTVPDVHSNSELSTCAVPPPGWYCTRVAGHDGPCAAWPQNTEVEKQ